MKILAWNCRGARRHNFEAAARQLFFRYNPDVVIIMDTQLSFEQSTNIVNKLLYRDRIIVAAEGRAGGIWVLWNGNQLTLSQTLVSNRTVHAMLSFNNTIQPFMLSAVYNYAQPSRHSQVWNELVQISANYSGKWVVLGDFNCILNEEEKKGGIRTAISKMLRFRDCIAQCRLVDLGFAGHPFTWTNRRFGRQFICERLDRALANADWCNSFPNAKLYHLNSSSSDHSPILLNTHDRDQRKPHIFIYEIAWSLHDDFINVIKECWNNQADDSSNNFYDNYCRFRARVLHWKKYVFGNINRKIEQIENHLETCHQNLSRTYSEEIHQQIINLENKHQLLLTQKEIYWKQRSRVQWLREGDNNTKFFHAYASNRRRRNLIQSLKYDDNWIHNINDITHIFTQNFRNLYVSNNNQTFSFNNCLCNTLDSSLQMDFCKYPDNSEIFSALKRIGPDKAPGPDGLNAHFFQKYWPNVGPSTIEIIKTFFVTNSLKTQINETRIILIPKNNNPYLINHFRPISLCNVLYKIIANILVNRIRPHIDKLISPLQNAFIPKRQISDNIGLAHEILHSMRRKKCKTSYMALKIDLEKAYDKLEWNFIKNALTKINFPDKFINWILQCIQTVNFSLNINEVNSEKWSPQKGIR